jgi:hypothetical protein
LKSELVSEDDMRRFIALAVIFEVVVARGCTAVQAEAATDQRSAVVRIYNYAGLADSLLEEAARNAASIFGAAGVTSQWRICVIRQDPSEPDDRLCEGSPDKDEFTLRINQGPGPDAARQQSGEVLGYAVILKRKGVLATVHSRRVLALASRSGVEAAVLMGRVMAHEVGHLLLGTNAHAPRGLMRADWKLNQWSMSEHSDWTFTADEVLRMRRSTLSARN